MTARPTNVALGDQALAVIANSHPLPLSTDTLAAAVGTIVRPDPRTGHLVRRPCNRHDLYPILRRLRRTGAVDSIRLGHNTASYWSLGMLTADEQQATS